jgi:serine phosphatase RsbU (regulator of sigma subunit)
LLAAPGYNPEMKANFVQMGVQIRLANQKAALSFDKLPLGQIIEGVYENPALGAQDIVAILPLDEQHRLLVHQSQAAIEELASRHLQPFILMGVGVILFIGFITFSATNRIVNQYEGTIEKKNQELTRAYHEILEKNEQISEQKQNILDSIQYASRIQEAMLTPPSEIQHLFPQSFTFFRPKDIVSGDFYWLGKRGKSYVFIVADCTGHGVPGAFMSMIGNNLLNEIVNIRGITHPAEIFSALDSGIRNTLKQEQTGNKDGMDLSICVFNAEEKTLELASVVHTIYAFVGNESLEIKGAKRHIGGKLDENAPPFESHTIELTELTQIYLATDGFKDQFGGPENKKFQTGQFRALLQSIKHLPASAQKETIEKTFFDWKGANEQVDDILIAGLFFSIA